MNDTMLMDAMNRVRTGVLKTDGCRRCVRTRVRWLTSEFRRPRRAA